MGCVKSSFYLLMIRELWSRQSIIKLGTLVTVPFFLIANRGAYKGYFTSDDLSNLNIARQVSGVEFTRDLFSPRIFSNNFRPVGHFFYHWMESLAGLDFPSYIAAIHTL